MKGCSSSSLWKGSFLGSFLSLFRYKLMINQGYKIIFLTKQTTHSNRIVRRKEEQLQSFLTTNGLSNSFSARFYWFKCINLHFNRIYFLQFQRASDWPHSYITASLCPNTVWFRFDLPVYSKTMQATAERRHGSCQFKVFISPAIIFPQSWKWHLEQQQEIVMKISLTQKVILP